MLLVLFVSLVFDDEDELDELLWLELELELLFLELELELLFLELELALALLFDELELALLLPELDFEESLLLLELVLELELFTPRLILTGPGPALDTELELVLLLAIAGAELPRLTLDEAVLPLLLFDVLLALDDGVPVFELLAVGVLELVLSAKELCVCELLEPSLKVLD